MSPFAYLMALLHEVFGCKRADRAISYAKEIEARFEADVAKLRVEISKLKPKTRAK